MRPALPEVPRFTAEVLGVETAYYALGPADGRPLLLLHGMSTSADSFRETMHGLAGSFRLIAPDIPGFGYSGDLRPYTIERLVAWLVALVDALALPPAGLIGHSFGGLLATAFALAHAPAVTRLLLIAPSLLTQADYPDVLKRAAIGLGLLDLGTAVSQSSLWVRRQIKTPFYDPEAQPPEVWERRLRDYALARASADVLKASAFYDVAPRLTAWQRPVCLVWGAQDPVVDPAQAEVVARAFSAAPVTIHKLDACGHVAMIERGDVFPTIARDFFARP